jgi:hypothetical protein
MVDIFIWGLTLAAALAVLAGITGAMETFICSLVDPARFEMNDGFAAEPRTKGSFRAWR